MATTVGLVLAAVVALPGSAAVSNDYVVDVLTVPGVDTGLVLANGASVTVSATGAVCPWGTSVCVGPDGDSSTDTTLGGFLLPGAPAWGLVGRVGSGPWVQVGSGPTTLSGSGDLVFAMNDNNFPDNTGSFTVAVADSCRWPGYGYGDGQHNHSGPPPTQPTDCYPGYGYGDTNRTHNGPPGRDPTPSAPAGAPTATSGSSNGASATHGSSKGARGRK